MRRLRLSLILALLPLSAFGEELSPRESSGWNFTLGKHPSLRWGKLLRIDFRAKVQSDFRTFDPDHETAEGLYELRRARVGIEGRFTKELEFELERELSDTKNPWKDCYVNWRRFRRVQLKAGKFKMPFGMEELGGPMRNDFVYNAGITEYLAPGRDIGVMAHGRFFHHGLSYEAGIFRHDGDNARTKDNGRASGATFSARLTGAPLRLAPVPALLKELQLGGAFTFGDVEEGPNSLRGRTVAKEYYFKRLDVSGRRLRLGTEAAWEHGPFGLNAEYIQVSDQRLHQGLLGDDLPDLTSRGWYVSGTWTVFDRTEASRNKQMFVRSVFETEGLGAVQLVARYEQLRFGSAEHSGPPSRSPRADNILGNSNRATTFGANWRLNRHTRFQVNAVREKIEDIQRSPLPGREHFWTRLCRLQFVL